MNGNEITLSPLKALLRPLRLFLSLLQLQQLNASHLITKIQFINCHTHTHTRTLADWRFNKKQIKHCKGSRVESGPTNGWYIMHLMYNAQNELRILPIVGKLQNGPSGGEGEGVGGVQIIYIHRYVCSICQMSCLGWIHQAFGVRKYLRLIRRHVAAIIVTKCRTP